MKRQFFNRTVPDDVAFEKLSIQPDIIIRHLHSVDGKEYGCGTMVYYEDLVDTTSREKTKLTWIKDKAIKLALDEKYQKLSNATQRKFYLLETYGYCSTDSADIIEYLGMMKKLAGE